MKNWLVPSLFVMVLFAERSYAVANEGVRLAPVVKGDVIQRVTIGGIVVPKKQTSVLAPYSGYVKKIFAKVGDQVKQGDPIVSFAQTLQSQEPAYPLLAPFSGTVVQVQKTEGAYVKEADNKEFILRIDDTSTLYIACQVPEIDLVKLNVGQEATIKASAILTRTYKGIVDEIALAATEKESYRRSQVEFPVKIKIVDADEQLKPGMSAILDIVVNKKADVLTLRHEFIHKDDQEYYILLEDGVRQPIKVGLQNEEVFEITAGVREGENVRQVDFLSLTPKD